MSKTYEIVLVPTQNIRYRINRLSDFFQTKIKKKFKKQDNDIFKKSSTSEKIFLELSFEEGEFIFHLNKKILKEIFQIQDKYRFYKVKSRKIRELLIDLIQNILFSNEQIYFDYGLTFTTCYYPDFIEPNPEKGYRVVRTFIALDGDIFLQIHKNYLSDNYQNLVLTHHLLINKVLYSLRTSILDSFNHCAVLIGILIAILRLSFSLQENLIFQKSTIILTAFHWLGQLILIEVIWLGFFLIIKSWIFPRIKSTIWKQIINPRSLLRSKIAKFLLRL
jgi:hypothetical protein